MLLLIIIEACVLLFINYKMDVYYFINYIIDFVAREEICRLRSISREINKYVRSMKIDEGAHTLARLQHYNLILIKLEKKNTRHKLFKTLYNTCNNGNIKFALYLINKYKNKISKQDISRCVNNIILKNKNTMDKDIINFIGNVLLINNYDIVDAEYRINPIGVALYNNMNIVKILKRRVWAKSPAYCGYFAIINNNIDFAIMIAKVVDDEIYNHGYKLEHMVNKFTEFLHDSNIVFNEEAWKIFRSIFSKLHYLTGDLYEMHCPYSSHKCSTLLSVTHK